MCSQSTGDFPRPEDGHFTVLSGECEVLQFPDESVPQLKLLYLSKQKKFDEAKKLVGKKKPLYYRYVCMYILPYMNTK